MRKNFVVMGFLIVLLLSAGADKAAAVLIGDGQSHTFSANETIGTYTFSASANFSLDGQTLTVVLTNTSSQAVTDPYQLLSTLFWYSPTIDLSPQTAALTSGSSWVNPNSLTINTGNGWGYGSSSSPNPSAPNGANQGISSVGLSIGLFGNGNFAGNTGDVALNGDNYAILPENGISGNGNNFNNKYPIAKNSMTFSLLLPNGVDSLDISNVSFHYGSAITDPTIPANTPIPPSALLLGSGLLGLGIMGWRRQKS